MKKTKPTISKMTEDQIVKSFLGKHHLKRRERIDWSKKYPESFKAAVKLCKLGYKLTDIADHIGIRMETLRRTLTILKIYKPRKRAKKKT